jgi:SHO1 osmosensor
LFLILGVVHTLATDSIAMHRFQLSTFLAIAVVFSVIGVNQSIFSNRSALDAIAAGWLILAVVNILWTLYFTSEEDSLMLHVFNAAGTGGLTPPGRRRRRTQSAHNLGTNGYAGGGYAAPGSLGPSGYDAKPASFTGAPIGSGASYKAPSVDNRSINQNSINNTSMRGPGSAVGDTSVGLASPMMGPGAAGVGAGGGPGNLPNMQGIPAGAASPVGGSSSPLDSPGAANTSANKSDYAYRAKAMYPCMYMHCLMKNISANIALDVIDKANEDDPNEISFEKNEVLEVLDKGGKWWQVKRQDGTIGSAS